MVSASEVFMGFSRYYNSLGIVFEGSIKTNTERIISYLDNLGRMLGYRIFSELPFSPRAHCNRCMYTAVT